LPAPARFQESRGDDEELMAQSTFVGQPRPRGDALLIEVWQQVPQLRVGQAGKLASRA